MAPTQGTSSPTPATDDPTGYTVIARRYRPQRFEDVVGQDHVVQALRNAIRMNRVTHAYLFSGTRGVGKTSIARIFAKCLNCVHGPTETPCNVCDICRLISTGDDIDVVEIDGASNNGVESVRELRQNAGLRPSRARFKIYYIDEVHMLSTGAFNALLKTLEEPPEHVKFFFATTEPNKIPVTVLSRCQRYDFAGITPEQVVDTLASICEQEHVKAEPDALRVVARRASGSMRDAQSLLEQLLSAGGESLTVELVHKRLGTASDERLLDLIDALADHDPAAALQQIERAASEGVQPADLLRGLLGFLRDLMTLALGADGILLTATPRQAPRLQDVVKRWSIDSIIAAMQILDEYQRKLRGSPDGRLLVELALVRAARLENLQDISTLIARLSALETGGSPPPSAQKKKPEPLAQPSAPRLNPPVAEKPAKTVEPPVAPLELASVRKVWDALLKKVGPRLTLSLSGAEPFLAISAPNILAFQLPPGYNGRADECDSPEARAKIEQALLVLLGRPVTIRVERAAEPTGGGSADEAEPISAPRRREDVLEGDSLVRKVVEIFEARHMHSEFDDDAPRPSGR